MAFEQVSAISAIYLRHALATLIRWLEGKGIRSIVIKVTEKLKIASEIRCFGHNDVLLPADNIEPRVA